MGKGNSISPLLVSVRSFGVAFDAMRRGAFPLILLGANSSRREVTSDISRLRRLLLIRLPVDAAHFSLLQSHRQLTRDEWRRFEAASRSINRMLELFT
jgi:hypothetical protein